MSHGARAFEYIGILKRCAHGRLEQRVIDSGMCERAHAGGHFQAAGAWTNAQASTGQETRAPDVRGDRASEQGAVKIMVDP